MGLTAACWMLAALVIWLAVKFGATSFVRYFPAPVGRGLGLGIGVIIIWIQLKTMYSWFIGPKGNLLITNGALGATFMVVGMVVLALMWRSKHPTKPYLLALLPVSALAVWAIESTSTIPFAWLSAGKIQSTLDMLPPFLPTSFLSEIFSNDGWALVTTVVTVLGAQALFLAFTFIVDSAGNAVTVEELTGKRYDLDEELRASALAMAVVPWFGLVPPSSNMAATRPIYTAKLGAGMRDAARWASIFAAFFFMAVMVAVWFGLDRVPKLFMVAALIVIGYNMIDASLLKRPSQDEGERQMWFQSWGIGLIFIFTSGIFAMLAGFAVAVTQFVRGAEGAVVRAIYTLREMRSRKWRHFEQEVALKRVASRAVVVQLQGTANFAVAKRIQEEVYRVAQPKAIDAIIIDAQRVVHWDLTAMQGFVRLSADLKTNGIELAVAQVGDEAHEVLKSQVRLFQTVDAALEWSEDLVLERQGMGAALTPVVPKTLSEVPIFRPLSKDGIGALFEAGAVKPFKPQQTVFANGDTDTTIFCILVGSVSMEVQGTGGPLRIATFTAGMIFGEMAFLDGSVRSARAVAAEKSHVFCFNRISFERWAELYPKDANALLGGIAIQLASRMRSTTTQLIALNP
jgi:MFS superfamily sulfate permease-like transporter